MLVIGKLKWLSHPTLCNPMDCSLPGSSDHGILQARILEWVASLLQRVFPTQGSNPALPHCRQILYCLSYQGSQQPGMSKYLFSEPGDPKDAILNWTTGSGLQCTIDLRLYLLRRKCHGQILLETILFQSPTFIAPGSMSFNGMFLIGLDLFELCIF